MKARYREYAVGRLRRIAGPSVWIRAMLPGLLALTCLAQTSLELSVHMSLVPGGPALETPALAGRRLRLERSPDLRNWTELARVHERLEAYEDRGASGPGARFYRVQAALVEASDDWSNQLRASSGSLFKPGTGGGLAATALVKWSLLLSDPDRRNYEMTLDFPYPVNATRTTPPNASDPYYELTCRYATPQPEFDWSAPALSTTTADSVRLAQMDPDNNPAKPDQSWWLRRDAVSKNGVTVNLHYFVGMPLHRGEPPWILKTFLLDRWLSPSTGSGRSLPAFSTDSDFAQTLLPGHHNFVETVLLEPGLDPAISEATRAALREANIRQIYALKDLGIGLNDDDLRYFGFDNSIWGP